MTTISETDSLGEKILLEMKILKGVRKDYETGLWIDIGRFVNPRRENISQNALRNTKGQRRGQDSYDGTPLSALNTWADGMQGFLVSESLNWFRSEMDNPYLNDNDNVRKFLQDYDLGMYSAFRRSNYYAVQGEWFRDAGSIGTATLYTEEDIVRGCSVHLSVHPREVYIAENKFGEVDTVFREFELTARQAIQKFDENKLSELIKQNAAEHPEKRHLFIHAVFPNTDKWPGRQTTRKKFRSVYVEVKASGDKQSGNVVRDSGYDINPYAVWRFRKNSDEIYGYSPAADALVEVFSLHQFGKTLMDAAHKSVSPAMNVPIEMRNNVRIGPKGYNYYHDPERIVKPVTSGIDYPVGIEQLDRLKASVEDKYRVEFFLTLARAEREMTATEIMERQSEKAVLMGPQVDRLYNEGIKKVFDIASDIEDRAGRLPDPDDYNLPDEFYEDGQININLTGPLAQAQKRLFKIQPIRSGINELAAIAAIKPEVLDRVDWQELPEDVLEGVAFPQKLILSDEAVAKIQEERARQAAQQKALEVAGAAAEAVPKLSKKPEEGSPAEAIMGAMGA